MEAKTLRVQVEELQAHRFYFPPSDKLPSPTPTVLVTMVRPHARWLGKDVAALSYTRLTQRSIEADAITDSCCKTRIWQRPKEQ
jgi:hypothetical protein